MSGEETQFAAFKEVIFGNDKAGVKGVVKQVEDMNVTLKNIEKFMENLSGLNNFVTGVDLLKKPSLWLLAFVIGIVALFGGLKTLLGWFFVLK